MNNDLKEQDMSYSGDPMFDEMLKDLLSLSATNEDLERQSSDDNTTNSSNNCNL